MTQPKSNPQPSGDSWLNAWHVDPAVNRNYDFIDGLRGIAILMVICCHHFYVNPQAGPAVQFIGDFFGGCGRGVVLFFALSGFLIAWPFWKRKVNQSPQTVPPGYARRRFWKIYPPLALSAVLFATLQLIRAGDASYFPIAARWLSGLAFLMPVDGHLNPVMWSLAVEGQFYIFLPLFFLACRRLTAQACLGMTVLCFLLIPVAVRLWLKTGPEFHPCIDPHFPSGLDAFFLGVLVAGLHNLNLIPKGWAKVGCLGFLLWPLVLLVSAAMTANWGPQTFWQDQGVDLVEKIASGLLLLLVADPSLRVVQWLCHPMLRWCGIISYEWYLFHQPIFYLLRFNLGPAGGNMLVYLEILGGSLVTGLVIAALVYRYFSLPLLKRGRQAPAAAKA